MVAIALPPPCMTLAPEKFGSSRSLNCRCSALGARTAAFAGGVACTRCAWASALKAVGARQNE